MVLNHDWAVIGSSSTITFKCANCGYLVTISSINQLLELNEFWADREQIFIKLNYIIDPDQILETYAPEYGSCYNIEVLNVLLD